MTQETDNKISVNITVPPPFLMKPTEEDGYMIVAHDLLQGVEALSAMHGISPRACAMIAGQALECALKAFLCYKGEKAAIGKHDIRHNIEALWALAYKEKTLRITEVPPDWVKILGWGHGPNFYFRYQEGEKNLKGNRTIVHGGQTPALIPMAIELGELVRKVQDVIKS
jgi:hypothetical protein